MANDLEVPRTDTDPPDEEGGPVKTFLEHLEDLRWVLIKSLCALGVGMLICLIGGDHVVRILTWPLSKATVRYTGTNEVWTVRWGTNVVKVLKLTDEQQAQFGSSGSRFKSLEVYLVPNGTN